MELEDFKTIWGAYDQKLDKALQYNAAAVRSLTLGKVQSALRRFMTVRMVEAVLAFIVIGFLSDMALEAGAEWGVMASALTLCLFAVVGLVGCVQQMILAARVDYAAPIPMLQKNLIALESHALGFARFALLSFPLYLAYIVVFFKAFWDVNILATADTNWLIAQSIVGAAFVPPVIWLWRTVNHRNIHIPWVAALIRQIGGEPLTAAMVLLREIEEFESEGIPSPIQA
jgi:hypothetical protein